MNHFELMYGDTKDAQIAKMKAQIIILLTQRLREKFKTRKEMVEFLEVSPSEVSKIMNGQLSSISFEKLFKHLMKMGLSVEANLTIYLNAPVKCEIVAK